MPFLGSQPAEVALTTGDLGDNIVDGTKTKDALIADYSDVTITAADLIMYGDATDSNNTKRDTVQGILDLASGGILLQVVEMGLSYTSGTTTIPFDDTTPTNTEGTQIGSQAITMADDDNKVLIEGQIQFGVDTSAIGVTVAVFRGSTNVGTYDHDQTDSQTQTNSIPIHILDSPATEGSVTYSVRIGAQGSATWRLNFGTSADDYGGSRKSTLFLKELSV